MDALERRSGPLLACAIIRDAVLRAANVGDDADTTAAIAGQESITLNKNGDGYTGTFTIDQYDTNGNLIVELKGNQTATRITVDTTIDQML